MDTKSLLTYFLGFFRAEWNTGLHVNAVAIAPAYGGMVADSYILAVSAPSLADLGCYDKSDAIIQVLYGKVPVEQRSLIDRVRVYDSAEELTKHAEAGFDERFYNYCELSLVSPPEEATA